MTATLTTDLQHARAHLAEHGYCLLEGLLRPGRDGHGFRGPALAPDGSQRDGGRAPARRAGLLLPALHAHLGELVPVHRPRRARAPSPPAGAPRLRVSTCRAG